MGAAVRRRYPRKGNNMTGYQSKRDMAQDKLITGKEQEELRGHTPFDCAAAHLLMVKCFKEEHDKHRRKTTDDDTQVYKDHGDALTIAYQSGYYDGKKAALAGREWNFCERCGKRTADLTVIHTCTPPQEGT